MGDLLDLLLWISGALVFGGFGSFAWTSLREGERRASRVSPAIAVVGGGSLLALSLTPTAAELAAVVIVVLAGTAVAVLFARPMGETDPGPRIPDASPDERDIMFSRGILEADTPQYESYYAMRPEKKESDDRTRGLPLPPSSPPSPATTEPTVPAARLLNPTISTRTVGSRSTATGRWSPRSTASRSRSPWRWTSPWSVERPRRP